jgi:truncated hemoglobin YjbI
MRRLGDSVDWVSNEGFDGSVYDAVGGRRFFVDLVDGFYAGVSADLLLRPLYPEDLTDSRHHLTGFLTQYWGGPPTATSGGTRVCACGTHPLR